MIYIWLLGCQDTPEKPIETETNYELPSVSEEEIGTGGWSDESIPEARVRKRMKVSQIRVSMEQITGIVWGGSRSKWDTYADSLGVPNYQQRMTEDRTPSVIFQKFLNDAATESCSGWLQATDEMFVVAESDVSEGAVRQNVAELRWLIQGHDRSSQDPIIDDYLALHHSVFSRTQQSTEAWHTVCVAMFTHPDFWMY